MSKIILEDKTDYIEMIKWLVSVERTFSTSCKKIEGKESFIIIIDPEVTMTLENTINIVGFKKINAKVLFDEFKSSTSFEGDIIDHNGNHNNSYVEWLEDRLLNADE